jgi:hypothetical protein
MRAIESTDLLLNFTKYDNFNLWKIVKIVATRCQILRLKCTKFDFGWVLPQTPLGSLQRFPRPPSWILGGLLLRGEEKKGGQGGREGERIRQGR